MRVSKVGGGTLLAGIVRLVQESQATKASMQVRGGCRRGTGVHRKL
jgi:hypothetical protein